MITYEYELIKIFKNAELEAFKLEHNYIGTEHFLLSILKSNTKLNEILNKNNITYEKVYYEVKKIKTQIHNYIPLYTPLFKRLIISSTFNNKINSKLLLCRIIEEGEGIALSILNDLNINIRNLYKSISNNKISYGTNLNDEVKTNYERIFGRNDEIDDIIEVLLRKNKNNPVLVGKAGVGKTAIIEELAYRINKKQVPYELFNKQIISINLSEIISGTRYRGEFEEKINNLIKEVESNSNIILFIDEIHTLIGAGGAEGAIDASNILKPYLARNKIKCIGATTEEEYNKYILKDKALNRRFYKIIINEPNIDETINIVNKSKKYYEKYHNVYINSSQVKLIVNLSNKYIKDRYEPDKSLDILDKICTKAKLLNYKNNNFDVNKKLKLLLKEKNNYIKSKNFKKAINIDNKINKLKNKKIIVNNLFIKNCFNNDSILKIGYKI